MLHRNQPINIFSVVLAKRLAIMVVYLCGTYDKNCKGMTTKKT